MDPNQVSVSARISAWGRGYHATHVEPKIFDDFLAAQLFTPEENALFRSNFAKALEFFDPELAATMTDEESAIAGFIRVQGSPITLSRARYVEDCLEAAIQQGVKQYVILGAGLDTFAWRRPDLLDKIEVFELDHPGTQAFKQQRLADLGWNIPPRLHFLPIDFNTENLADVLTHSSYDPHALSFFNWLGVTYYLSRAVVFNTLRQIASIAPTGSSVIFDYLDTDAFIPEKTAKRVQKMQAATMRSGEPMQTGFDPANLATELEPLGFTLRENLDPDEIQARFFRGRTDGYYAFEHIHFAWAKVK